jgi:hypothetical protein
MAASPTPASASASATRSNALATARIDSPTILRGALLRFPDGSPPSPEPFPVQMPGPGSPVVEAVGIFCDVAVERRDLSASGAEELFCWLRREGDAFRIVRVDPRYPMTVEADERSSRASSFRESDGYRAKAWDSSTSDAYATIQGWCLRATM